MPGVQAKDVAKLKKQHPLAVVFATPIGYEDSWNAAIDEFLKIGETALLAYDRLSRYQREVDSIDRLELEDLWDCLDGEDDPSVDIYFPSDKFLIEIDKSREKSLQTLRTIVARELEHHRLIAEEPLWNGKLDKREFIDDELYPDGLDKALERLHNFIA